MWISQKVYLAWMERQHQTVAERDAAVQQLKQQETTLGWFMHRLTQIEQERSKLIFNYTGVRIEAPAYEKADDPATEAASMLNKNPLNSLPNFNDVGDEEAAKQGIGWDDEGNVQYAVTK